VRVFKAKPFGRFAKKAGIDDSALCMAIRDAEKGLLAADLGGGVVKQRIARPGRGKSGGFRTLIAFRRGSRAVFVHGFAKNEKDNIGKDELVALRKLASEMLAYDEKKVEQAVASGALIEVVCDEKAIL
jgi:hypothetical protein